MIRFMKVMFIFSQRRDFKEALIKTWFHGLARRLCLLLWRLEIHLLLKYNHHLQIIDNAEIKFQISGCEN